MQQQHDNLDTPLFRFSNEPDSEALTVGDSHCSILVTGAPGSGKSSGTSYKLARSFLKAGYGGIVFSVKPEREFWEKICAETGRSNDLIIIGNGKNNDQRFNFINYISTLKGDVSYADNIYKIITEVVEASKENTGAKDEFWSLSLGRLLINTIELSLLSFNSVSIQLLYDLATTAPQPSENRNAVKKPEPVEKTIFDTAMEIVTESIKEKIDTWNKTLRPEWLESVSQQEYELELGNAIPEFRRFKIVKLFFKKSFYEINPKTRTLILYTLTTFLEGLLREPFFSLFCTNTTFTPEDCLKGKVILIDLPILEYDKTGRDCQLILKLLFQKAFLKRDIKSNERSVFMYADESQHIITKGDAEFVATARGYNISSVYITQSISNFHMFMGESSEHKVNAFLAAINCKIMHCNSDTGTNNWASELIGDDYVEDASRSVQLGGDFSMSSSTSFKLERRVQPIRFQFLKTGGKRNNYQVHAIIHMLDKNLKHGNYQIICFNQNQFNNSKNQQK